MSALKSGIFIVWALFWAYWLISAFGAKRSIGLRRVRPPGLIIVVAGFIVVRVFKGNNLVVHSVALEIVGTVLLVSGLALAVWARLYLGRNWGMPMTQKPEPELVTSGPYQYVRHPIYSGILLATLGTAVATNLIWLIVLAVIGVYFIYSAKVEEGLMTTQFPTVYPGYMARTKMLIPFVL